MFTRGKSNPTTKQSTTIPSQQNIKAQRWHYVTAKVKRAKKKKKTEEGRWIKLKEQTKEKTAFERRCNERISWDQNFFPYLYFLTSKCKISYQSLIKKTKSYL